MKKLFLTLSLLLLAAAPASAQHMPPLFFVKLIGPKGMQVTFYRGNAQPQTFDVPAIIGVRPGYSVRLAISNVPGFPGDIFYPTLDVHGSLLVGSNARAAQFPAALVFSADDFARVKGNSTIKKLVVLEKPDVAIPVATKPDEPFEINVPADRDPFQEAREHGQFLVVVQMGERQRTQAELCNVTGTLLLPGEKVLMPPVVPPWLAWHCCPVVDPRVGAGDPGEFWRIPDGGDVDFPAGFDRDGKLRGLDPSDTVAEYNDSRGRQRLACSNRVALCVPRYLIVKTQIALDSRVALFGPGAMKSASGPAGIKSSQPPLEASQRLQLENVATNLKPSGNVQTIGPAVTGRIENLVVVGSSRAVQAFESAMAPTPCEPEEGPLCIFKWPDRCDAMVGDTVTFTLKYTNTGGRPITNVIVSDSLTNRLEYVPGSAKTDREAIFTTQPNDAGSQVLRWEITGTLSPHASGMVQFQVRVR